MQPVPEECKLRSTYRLPFPAPQRFFFGVSPGSGEPALALHDLGITLTVMKLTFNALPDTPERVLAGR